MNHFKMGLSIEKILFISMLIFFTSCTYEPFDIYENPVNTNLTEPQIINLELNVNADTLWVYGNQIMKYHFKSSNEKQSIIGLEIYIDGEFYESVMSDNGEFNFLQSLLSEGIHKMKILLYTKSGTGSIADRLNGESILLSKEWVVMADYSNKDVTYTIENGYLKLQWEMYKNLDLKSYKIQYTGSTQNNYFVDSLYYGQKRTVNITVEKTNGDIIPWTSLDLEENIPKPVLKQGDNYSYYFTWTKSPYYNSVKYLYQLYADYLSNYGDYGSKSVNDTIYHTNLHFSDSYNFILYTLPKNHNENFADYMSCPNVQIIQDAGEPANIRSYTSYISADTLMAFDNKNIYKYLLGGETIDSEPIIKGHSFGLGYLQISPRGKYLLGFSYRINGSGLEYFAKELSTGNIYYMDYVDPGYDDLNFHLSTHISDNGIGIFESSTKEFIFDFRNNIEIASRPLSKPQQNLYVFKIAADGKHVMTANSKDEAVVDVYKIKGSNLEKMYSFESYRSIWQFSPIDPNMITTLNDNTLSIIQCEPYALIRKIEFASDEVFMNIDYFNNEVLTISSNQFIIRSLENGNVIKRIPKSQDKYYLVGSFKLHNHHILKDNLMLKIQ